MAHADCGSEFYSHIWLGHCPSVYPVSQKKSWIKHSSFVAKSGFHQGQRDLTWPTQQDFVRVIGPQLLGIFLHFLSGWNSSLQFTGPASPEATSNEGQVPYAFLSTVLLQLFHVSQPQNISRGSVSGSVKPGLSASQQLNHRTKPSAWHVVGARNTPAAVSTVTCFWDPPAPAPGAVDRV